MSDQQWLAVALEEYKSLRTESLTAMANQQATLRFGMAALGAALALAVNTKTEASFWAFSLLIPFFSLMFFALYAIEFGRMARVGTYIKHVENKINTIDASITPKYLLTWETWLAKEGGKKNKTPRLKHYEAVPLTFCLVTTFSIWIASRNNYSPFPEWNERFLLSVWIVIILSIAYITWNLTRSEEFYQGFIPGTNSNP